MFKIFKKKCPTCGMVLEEGKTYPEGFGKQFYSERCKEQYRELMNKKRQEQHSSHGGCC